ncbi:HAD-like domain-containing protein [Coprinopsis sp. MPI-PUGE-AT-0042]|nr:HAD-like domain-containing protein [Coprinopsis sp. MPI-PUGE-AT-0042]
MVEKIADIEYVLFDMDGLMIDSERIYTDVTSQIFCTKDTILGRHGEVMTWEMKAGCMGKPELEATEFLLSHFPNIPITNSEYLAERNALQDALWPTVSLLPGVAKLVSHLSKHNIPFALATGSRRSKYLLKTAHLPEVFGAFEGRVVCSSDVELVKKGKPHPDIFLVAAKEMLGRDVGDPEGEISEKQREERRRGLVLEDAVPGVQAGKRAGMNVLWVPDPKIQETYDGEEVPDKTIKSLEEFVPEEWGLPPYDS